MSLYLKDGKLHYDYNYLDGVHYHLSSPVLPQGETELKFNFNKTVEFGGIGELYVNDQTLQKSPVGVWPQMGISIGSSCIPSIEDPAVIEKILAHLGLDGARGLHNRSPPTHASGLFDQATTLI